MARLSTGAADGGNLDTSPQESAAVAPPRPRSKNYEFPTFASRAIIEDVIHIEFTGEWVIFHHNHLDHGDLTAFPSHYVRGAVREYLEN